MTLEEKFKEYFMGIERTGIIAPLRDEPRKILASDLAKIKLEATKEKIIRILKNSVSTIYKPNYGKKYKFICEVDFPDIAIKIIKELEAQ